MEVLKKTTYSAKLLSDMSLRVGLISIIIFIFSIIFFSFRLLEVPQGITIDEAAFGYNASLLSETLHDENNRFLPIFVLSLEGKDWRQPITQYFQAGYFKIFGRSLYNLKFTSVLIIASCALLIFLLGLKIRNLKFGIISLVIFLTTPIIMIHSHLALDNIMPLPFILIWLLGLVLFTKNKSIWLLILAGFSLGISFYAHKSMRSASPIWAALIVGYLILPNIRKIKLFQSYKPILIFLFSILPFYLISPILDYKYAGAVYGNQNLEVKSFYDFLYFYISNFDVSFLFIKGDVILHHSTGIHGVFLLSLLPVFLYGIYKAIGSKNNLLIFLVICLFSGPLLFGYVGALHRASRLIFMVPFVCLISSYGLIKLFEIKSKFLKYILILYFLIFSINFYDFINYYWFKYPEETAHIFFQPNIQAYAKLNKIAKEEKLQPLVSEDLLSLKANPKAIEEFSRSLYFIKISGFDENKTLPKNSILLSTNPNLKNSQKLDSGFKDYYLYLAY